MDRVLSSESYNGEKGVFIPANEKLVKSKEALNNLVTGLKEFKFDKEYLKKLSADIKEAAPYAAPALGLTLLFLMNSACSKPGNGGNGA